MHSLKKLKKIYDGFYQEKEKKYKILSYVLASFYVLCVLAFHHAAWLVFFKLPWSELWWCRWYYIKEKIKCKNMRNQSINWCFHIYFFKCVLLPSRSKWHSSRTFLPPVSVFQDGRNRYESDTLLWYFVLRNIKIVLWSEIYPRMTSTGFLKFKVNFKFPGGYDSSEKLQHSLWSEVPFCSVVQHIHKLSLSFLILPSLSFFYI